MKLLKFRKVFQNISECQIILIHCLSDVNLFALWRAVSFWLSNRKKRVHLSLLWEVFEHIKWSENMKETIIIEWGLNFHWVEALMWESVIMHWKKVISFIIMIQSSFNYDNLVSWTKQALLSIMCSTKMTVTEAAEHSNFWNTTLIATIEDSAAGVEIFISITTLAQEAL